MRKENRTGGLIKWAIFMPRRQICLNVMRRDSEAREYKVQGDRASTNNADVPCKKPYKITIAYVVGLQVLARWTSLLYQVPI